jgi:predicted NBD/HSP70 family sugar kinase
VPRTLRQAAEAAGIRPGTIQGIGVDFPAPVNVADGKVLDLANLKHPDWRGFGVRDALQKSLNGPNGFSPQIIAVDNDAAAAMYGVLPELPTSEQRSLVGGYFIGTGLGGAFLFKGKNAFNNKGGGAEPGAVPINFDEGNTLLGRPLGACTMRLEQFISLTAIERQLRLLNQHLLIPADHPLLRLEAEGGKGEWRIRAQNVIKFAGEAFASGKMDDFSIRLFKVQQEVLGLHLAGIVQTFRPAHIFIGGGVVDLRRVTEEFRRWYVDGIRDATKRNIAQTARQETGFPHFHIPKDGDFAAPKGAALMAQQALASHLKREREKARRVGAHGVVQA